MGIVKTAVKYTLIGAGMMYIAHSCAGTGIMKGENNAGKSRGSEQITTEQITIDSKINSMGPGIKEGSTGEIPALEKAGNSTAGQGNTIYGPPEESAPSPIYGSTGSAKRKYQ
ncbi:MAG: hypothetical protein R6U32_01320 [Candidatus Woesearchaeota archaeon]